MISMGSARRRAEEFAALVDATRDTAAPLDPTQASYAELVALVSQMRAVPAPAPRPEFVADLRERLMAEADTVLVRSDSRLEISRPPVRRRDRRVAAVVGTAALLGAGTSVAVASQSALPGDALYPIKRALESAETSFEAGDDAKGASMTHRASTRLDELEQLARNDGDPAAMAETLADFVTQANQAADLTLGAYDASGDQARVVELRDFASDSLTRLAELKPLLPAELQPVLDNAVSALLALDARAVDACPSCGGPVDLPVSLVASGSGAPRPVLPALAPPTTIQPDSGTQTSQASSDPIRDLLAGLPALGTVLPDVSPEQTQGGTKGTTKGGGSGPLEGGEVLEPVEQLTDPLLGEEGLVGGGEALDGLLGGLTDPLLGDGSLADDTLGTDDLLD
jgi:hypothetical protein